MQTEVINCKPGAKISMDGELWVVVDYFHGRTAQRRANVRLKIKNYQTGRVLEKTYLSHDKVERVQFETRKMQFLYSDTEWHFMNTETYDQTALNEEQVGDAKNYLKENMEVIIEYYQDKPISIQLPTTVPLQVTHTEPGIKGDTVSNVTKPATLETGYVVQVPLFIKKGDRIKVSSDDASYLGRV